MEKHTQEKNWFARHKFLTGIIVFFLFVIIVGSLGDNNSSNNNENITINDSSDKSVESKKEDSNEKKPKEEEKEIEYTKVTADELCTAYEKNEISADKKYKDKLLEISGVVEGIDSDFMDNPVVKLKCGNEYSLTNVVCNFDNKDEAAELEKGKKITVTGKSTGEVIGSPTLENCKIKK